MKSKSKFREVASFLKREGTLDIQVLVKPCILRNNRGTVSFNHAKMSKLLDSGRFLVYVATEVGGVFITADVFRKFTHIHHNKLNPTSKTFMLSIMNEDGNLKPAKLSCNNHRKNLCEGRY